MKSAAAPEDIHHLFRIMLGRKPSPASYIETNTGAQLSELIRRMASSDEFAEKVLAPLQNAQGIIDRPLRVEERAWLTSSAQLPERLTQIISQGPTQFRAALTLAFRAFEGIGGSASVRRAEISSALNPLGVHLDEAADHYAGGQLRILKDQRISADDWQMFWRLFGGDPAHTAASPSARKAWLSDLASLIAENCLLSDQLVPALYRSDTVPGWSVLERAVRNKWLKKECRQCDPSGDLDDLCAAWSALLSQGDRARASQLLARIGDAGPDQAGSVEALCRAAQTYGAISEALAQQRLPQALLVASHAISLGDSFAEPLMSEIEDRLPAAYDWRDRLALAHFVDRLISQGANTATTEPSLVEIGLERARKVALADDDRIYLIVQDDYRVGDGIRPLLASALKVEPVIPLRPLSSEGEMPTALVSLGAEPVGIAVRSAIRLPEAIESLERQAFSGRLSIPATSAEAPTARSEVNRPIVLLEQDSLAPKGASGVVVGEDQSVADALRGHTGPDDLPVLISRPDFPVTDEHLAIAVAHFERFGQPPLLSLAEFAYSTWHEELKCRMPRADEAAIACLIWMPMAVFSLGMARALEIKMSEIGEGLAGAQDLLAQAALQRQTVFAASAEPAYAKNALRIINANLGRWCSELKKQDPPLAPNLVSARELRETAMKGPVAARQMASRALDLADAKLAGVERMVGGTLDDEEMNGIASPETTDLLLDLGFHVPFAAAICRLIAAQEDGVFLPEPVLNWVLRSAIAAGCDDRMAEALSRPAPAIIAAHSELISPVFETIATTLPSAAIATVLSACILRSKPSGKGRFVYRVAEITRKYLNRQEAEQVITALSTCGVTDLSQSIKSSLSVALSRGTGAPLTALPPSEAIIAAIEARDADDFLRAIRAHAEAETPLLDLLDPLRGYALELAEMNLPEDALPLHRCRDDREAAIAALIFGARRRLKESREGAVELDKDIAALISACTGDRENLAAYLCDIGGEGGPALGPVDPSSKRWLFDAYLAAPKRRADTADACVSFIVSSFETESALLHDSIRSLLNQSHEDIEVLLIEDGSNTTNRIDLSAFADLDPRIRTFRMPRNLGPYLCRNFALSIATGAFIAIQDADDISHPERIACQLAVMEAEPECQLVTSHHMRVDPRGWPQLEHGFRLLGDGTMTSLFRRSVFEQLGPFLPVRSRGDVEMRERIRRWHGASALHRIDFPLVVCHASPQTLSQRTATAKGNYLRLFRRGIDQTRLHPDHLGPDARPKISLPAALRA
ncbi:MAG: glycosyltransferase family A protein [Pseudomonadota bacterium]